MYNTVITIRFSFSHNFFSLVIIIMQGNKVSGQVCSIMNAVTSGVARIWKFCRPMAEQVPKVQAPVRKRCGVIASRRVREHASPRNFLKLRFCVFLFNVMKIIFHYYFFCVKMIWRPGPAGLLAGYATGKTIVIKRIFCNRLSHIQ